MANINDELNQIKNAVYGKEVRSSIHDGIKKINDESEIAKSVSNNAQEQVGNIQNQVDQLVIEGDSSVEAAQARVDADGNTYNTLKDRLDEKETEFTSQLNDTAQEIKRTKSIVSQGKKEKKASVTIVLDDATTTDYTMLDIALDKNIPFGIGVITDRVGDSTGWYMTWSQIKEMEASGLVEILSHTDKHPNLTELSEEEIATDLEESLRKLHENGFNVRGLVYPYNTFSDKTIKVAQRYFDFAFARTAGDDKGRNFPVINNQAIDRVSVGSYFDQPTEGFPSDTESLEYYKARVDEAIEHKSLLVLVMHSSVTSEVQWQRVKDLIDYIKSKNIDILKPSEAFDIHGNIIQTGTLEDGFIVDNSGKELKRYKHIVDRIANKYSSSDSWDTFPENAITSFYVNTNGSDGFPDNAGVVTTYRVGNQFGYYRQEFRSYLRQELWVRIPKTDGSGWGNWEKSNPIVIKEGIDPYESNTPINSFPREAVTTFFVQAKSQSGWPDSASGIVSTHRIGSLPLYHKQEFRKYDSNEEWVRYVSSDGVNWGEWTRRDQYLIKSEANIYSSTTPISNFPRDTITVFHVTAQSQSGWPGSAAGLVTTYRIGTQNGFYKQEFKKYQSNEVWSRWVDNNGNWTTWEKVSAV